MKKRRSLVIAAAVAVTAILAGCASDPVSEAYLNGTNQGYIGASGFTVEPIPVEERGEPIVFEGVDEYGKKVSSDDLIGNVSVVNFWYAACGPCRVEAPDLEAVWQEFKDDGVAFLGVNLRDTAPTAVSFAETYGITYPSAIDEGDAAVKTAFAQVVPLTAAPNTLVLDADGRVAARLFGRIESASILSTLVKETMAETE